MKRLQESYKQLLHSTGQVVAQAKRIAQEVDNGVKRQKRGSIRYAWKR